MIDNEKSLYSISVISELIGEHPETLRVWERNDLINPDRSNYQRRYSNNDLLRLQFIKYLIDEKGFNLASLNHLLKLYPCWKRNHCAGGMHGSEDAINEHKPCWKKSGTYCIKITDKAEMCCRCRYRNNNKKEVSNE